MMILKDAYLISWSLSNKKKIEWGAVMIMLSEILQLIPSGDAVAISLKSDIDNGLIHNRFIETANDWIDYGITDLKIPVYQIVACEQNEDACIFEPYIQIIVDDGIIKDMQKMKEQILESADTDCSLLRMMVDDRVSPYACKL